VILLDKLRPNLGDGLFLEAKDDTLAFEPEDSLSRRFTLTFFEFLIGNKFWLSPTFIEILSLYPFVEVKSLSKSNP